MHGGGGGGWRGGGHGGTANEFLDEEFQLGAVYESAVVKRLVPYMRPYKRHKHPDVAQQRFPDLSLRGRLNPPANGSSRAAKDCRLPTQN